LTRFRIVASELKARFLREQRWNHELRPDTGYMPTIEQRLRALSDAVELERAVMFPKQTHRVSEEAVIRELGEVPA